MPLPCGKNKQRYRWKTTSTGKKQRLGFCGNKVVEVKNGLKGQPKRIRS